MSRWVLDASAALAFLQRQPGREAVEEVLDAAAISTVNVAEVAARLAEGDFSGSEIRQTVESLGTEVVDFDSGLAYRAAELRRATKHAGLSLGDRACLATAQRLGAGVLTTDRSWAGLEVGVEIRVIR